MCFVRLLAYIAVVLGLILFIGLMLYLIMLFWEDLLGPMLQSYLSK